MIFCQMCLTPNPSSGESCRNCGQKLMVLMADQQWEERNKPRVSMEDHFLERISNLEDTLNNVLDHLSRLSDSFEGIERNAFITRSGLSSLIETLKESHQLREDLLHQRWEATMVEQMEEARYRERFVEMKTRFLALYRGSQNKFKVFKSYIEDAEFQILSDRSEDSQRTLKRALALDKQNYELAYYLAEQAHEQGHSKEAKALLIKAVSANPNHEDSLVLLSLIEYSDGNFDNAKELLQQAITTNPGDDLPYLCLGSIYSAEGNHPEAEFFLARALSIRPQAQSHYLMGLTQKELGNSKVAIQQLELATELDPEHEDAWFNLGLVYLARGWTRKARHCFNQALELNPNKIEFREALRTEQPQLGTTPPDIDAESMEIFTFAESLFRKGKYKQALPHYRQLLKKYPNNYIVLSSYAVLSFSLRRFEESHKVAAQILGMEIPPTVRCIAYTIQMESLRAMGQFEEAVEALERMAGDFPDGYGRVIANYGMSLTMADMGQDLRQAEQLAREALRLSSAEFKHHALDALGWVYFKQARYEESLELLESALALEENLNHLYHYGMVLLAMNLQDKAFEAFERAVRIREEGPRVDEFIFSSIRREMSRIDHQRKSPPSQTNS